MHRRLRIPKKWADQHLSGGTNPRYIFKLDGYELIGHAIQDEDPEHIYLVFQKIPRYKCTCCGKPTDIYTQPSCGCWQNKTYSCPAGHQHGMYVDDENNCVSCGDPE